MLCTGCIVSVTLCVGMLTIVRYMLLQCLSVCVCVYVCAYVHVCVHISRQRFVSKLLMSIRLHKIT